MIRQVRARRFCGGTEEIDEPVAIEEPLLVRVNGVDLAVLMRTPGADRELCAGFLLTEDVIDDQNDIESIEMSGHPSSAECLVTLKPNKPMAPGQARNFYRSSSCGVCGRTAIAALVNRIAPIEPLPVDPGLLCELPTRLERRQSAYAATGGLHAAGLFSADGTLLAAAEDVGRHNALDKVIGGLMFAGGLPARQRILTMSSRASFDIVQKAAVAGIPVVATIGAPSTLAVDLARAAGIALFGFLRGNRVTQYSG